MSAYVPLLQTLTWVLLIVGVLVAFRKSVAGLAAILRTRIERGAGVALGLGSVFSLQVGDLPVFPPQSTSEQEATALPAEGVAPSRLPDPDDSGAPAAWGQYRMERKDETRNIHLAHVISPSRTPGQRFDIFTYLVEGPGGRLSDVEKAQFFLGRYWGNRIFEVPNRGNGAHVGFATSAYGPALCICRVVFKDGSETVLERFLDFEMASVFETSPSHAA